MWRSGVQAKAGDDDESVTAPNIHSDPFPASATTVGSQIVRAQRGADKAGPGQSIGNSAGAVIAAVIEGAMATAVSIRFCAQLIRGPDNALHRKRGVQGRQGQSAAEPRLVSRRGRAGRRKRTGKAKLRREDKNHGDKNGLSNRDSHSFFNQRLPPGASFRKPQEVHDKSSQSIGTQPWSGPPLDAIDASRKPAVTSFRLFVERGNFFFRTGHLGFSPAAQGQKFLLTAEIQERRVKFCFLPPGGR